MAWCLAGLAGVAGARGNGDCAARLFGAEEAHRRRFNLLRQLVLYRAYEGDLAVARAQIDGGRWDTAWADGEALTPEQVIAYALDETNPEQSAQ